MPTFGEREDLFEKRFAHDQTVQFKAEARRAKLFGAWVAERLGLIGDEANSYAGDVVVSDLKEAGVNDILEKVIPDLREKGDKIPEDELRERLEGFMRVAREQVLKEVG